MIINNAIPSNSDNMIKGGNKIGPVANMIKLVMDVANMVTSNTDAKITHLRYERPLSIPVGRPKIQDSPKVCLSHMVTYQQLIKYQIMQNTQRGSTGKM